MSPIAAAGAFRYSRSRKNSSTRSSLDVNATRRIVATAKPPPGGGQLHNPVPSMRCLNDTLDTRRTFRVQECSRGLIGGDHEVFDQQARTILPPGLQIHDFAVGQDRLQFRRMERARARIVSSLTK